MRIKKQFKIHTNPRTGFQLRNDEVYCSFCGRNFGDIFTLQRHRVKGIFGEVTCVDPQSVDMQAHVNFSQAIVWRFSKW